MMDNNGNGKYKIISLLIVFIACLTYPFSNVNISSLFSSQKEISPIISVKYNDDLYTRGKIHYLSMDFGMKDCWNSTVKHLLQLTCPNITSNRKLELELAFYLTSCFCESIGKAELFCRDHDRSPGEIGEGYEADLIRCARGKCFNEYGSDGFHSIYSRIHDLCYFYEYESQYYNHDMKPYITDNQLKRLKKKVTGNSRLGWPTLKFLENSINTEIQDRKLPWKEWLSDQLIEFRLVLGDWKYFIKDIWNNVMAYYYYD